MSFQRAADLKKEARIYELLGGSLAELDRLAEAENAFVEASTLAQLTRRWLLILVQ